MKIKKIKKFKNNKLYQIGRFFLSSAPFALLISIVLFWVEMYRSDKENDEMIGELKLIEQSLSTRYIGIFPDYLSQINDILETTEKGDSVIIFEDVLYYGLFYNPDEFKQMIGNISSLAQNGHKITIAHYGIDSKQFREVVQESRIKKEYLSEIKEERKAIIEQWRASRNAPKRRYGLMILADSLASEKYFAKTRVDNMQDFEDSVNFFKTPIFKTGDNPLFADIDSIRYNALNKPLKEITFADFYDMYRNVSIAITQNLKKQGPNIEFIELDDYLVMSCWSNSKKILFALPGKFAADEIGFISSDDAIKRYINTQLLGVKE